MKSFFGEDCIIFVNVDFMKFLFFEYSTFRLTFLFVRSHILAVVVVILEETGPKEKPVSELKFAVV